MAELPSTSEWTGTASNKHNDTEVPMCPSSSFHAGFAHWSLVCRISIPYLGMRSLDHVFSSPDSILIYQVARTGLLLLSMMMYLFVSHGYRVRDWVVSVKWMVEDIFERRMDQGESYFRQQNSWRGILFKGASFDLDSDALDQLSNWVKFEREQRLTFELALCESVLDTLNYCVYFNI